jgi:hypothetical protein
MRHFTVRPLDFYPYISILQVGLRGENPVQYQVQPPLASPAKQAKFAPDMNQMALEYDLRVDEMPIFGNPDFPVPQTGIRVFSGDDSYLLLGGSTGEAAVLYRRTGPTYMRFNHALDLPTPPAYISHASFTRDGSRLALVRTDSPNTVKIYQRDELDNLNLIASVGVPAGSLEAVEFSPADTFLIVKTTTNYAIYSNEGVNFPSISGLPSGRLLAVSPDDRFFILDGNAADNLKVYEWGESGFLAFGDLPSTAGTERRATFNPDGDILVVTLISPTSGRLGPLSYFLHPEDGFVPATIDGLIWYQNQNPEVKFSRDSTYMYGLAGLYGKQEDFFYPHSPLMAVPGMPGDFAYLQIYHAFSPDGQQFAHVGTNGNILQINWWDGSQLTPLQTITGGTDRGYCFAWSPDGAYIAIYVVQANGIFREVQIWKWNADGQQYEQIPFSYTGDPKSTGNIRWTKDGRFLIISDRVYLRNGDDFTFAYTAPDINNPNLYSICLTNDNRIIYTEALSNRIRVGRYTTTQFIELPDVPNPSWLQEYRPVGLASSSDDSRLVVTFSGSTVTSRSYAIYAYDGSNYSLIASDDPVSPALVDSGRCAFSHDDQWVYVATRGVGGHPPYELKVFRYEDGGLKRVWTQTRPTSNWSYAPPALTPDNKTIIYAGWLYRAGVPYMAHSYRFLRGTTLGANEINDGFSPEGDIVHVTHPRNQYGTHLLTSDMVVPLQRLPFEDDFNASYVYDVQYSPQGTFVLWKNPDGLQLGVKRKDNTYIKLSRLNGTFVSVYWLNEGTKTFIEKGYMMHSQGASITNMVFSQTPIAFSYFALNGEEDPISSQGRHIFNTFGMTNFNLKGVEFEPDMMASYLAFSPFEVYFAATYRRPDGMSDIVLYKFVDGTLNYEAVDSKLVPFGPIDFSSCNHIVVAHGGFEYPFTIFEVDTETDTLVEKPYPPINWQHEGLILDIAFVNCEQMVVVTPEEIILVERDPESGEIEESDAVERDDEAGEDVDVIVLPDEGEGPTIIIHPKEPGEESDGYYGVAPDMIIPLTYIPYAAISFFYRE